MSEDFLAQYYDPALNVNGLDPQLVEHQERERLKRLLAMATSAAIHPRRVDGTPDEVAEDKRRSKRVAHAFAQSLVAWGEAEPRGIATQDIQSEAARVEWVSWSQRQRAQLELRIREIVTASFKNTIDPRWTKRAVVRYLNEIKWLEHALR